jgi:hypothetical protein
MRIIYKFSKYLLPVFILLLVISITQNQQQSLPDLHNPFIGHRIVPLADAQQMQPASPAALTGTPTPTIFTITQDPNAASGPTPEPPYSPQISPLIFIVPGVFILLTLFLR